MLFTIKIEDATPPFAVKVDDLKEDGLRRLAKAAGVTADGRPVADVAHDVKAKIGDNVPSAMVIQPSSRGQYWVLAVGIVTALVTTFIAWAMA